MLHWVFDLLDNIIGHIYVLNDVHVLWHRSWDVLNDRLHNVVRLSIRCWDMHWLWNVVVHMHWDWSLDNSLSNYLIGRWDAIWDLVGHRVRHMHFLDVLSDDLLVDRHFMRHWDLVVIRITSLTTFFFTKSQTNLANVLLDDIYWIRCGVWGMHRDRLLYSLDYVHWIGSGYPNGLNDLLMVVLVNVTDRVNDRGVAIASSIATDGSSVSSKSGVAETRVPETGIADS